MMRGMSLRAAALVLSCCLACGCIDHSPTKTFDMLDTRTGMTLGALIQPIACVETGVYDPLVPDKQPTIIYLGPVEWDRMGNYSYLLWVQVAPGEGGRRPNDLRRRDALRILLDDGPLLLTALDQPVKATSPYVPVIPVGQTVYFPIDVATLNRMAASKKLSLDVEAADLTRIELLARPDSLGALKRFLVERNVNED